MLLWKFLNNANVFFFFFFSSTIYFLKILDEKSLIKKYQKEISNLKEELQTLKHDTTEDPCRSVSTPEDMVSQTMQVCLNFFCMLTSLSAA